jgi:hypothetical protein
MKIIFLDVDGVLNHIKPGCLGEDFHPDNVAIANAIIKESGAKICVSSDWRMHDDIDDILHDGGIVGDIIGVTCRAYYSIDGLSICRGHEIDFWLKHDHECKLATPKHYAKWPDNFETPESFVILDDTKLYLGSAPTEFLPMPNHITDRLVQITGRMGLQPEHVQLALDVLNTPFTPPWEQEDAEG